MLVFINPLCYVQGQVQTVTDNSFTLKGVNQALETKNESGIKPITNPVRIASQTIGVPKL